MSVIDTIANNRFWNKHSVKLLWLFAVLFLVAIVLSIVWNAWSLSKIKQSNYQPQTVEPIAQSIQPSYQVTDITGANLFGDPTPVPVATEAPTTTLDLTLEGVLWSSDNSVGRAIIMVGKKAAELYSVGEDIDGASASVEEIRDGEIILNRNGVLESLPLIKMTTSGNREIFTFADEPYADEEFFETFNDDHSPIEPTDTNEINVSTPQADVPNGNRRVRRPNFSGLDRALEKMGEL